MARVSKVYSLSEEQFIEIINSSKSYAECCRKMGMSDKGRHGSDQIKKRCKELEIEITHFNKAGSCNTQRYTLDEILVEDSSYFNIDRLKKRLIGEGRLEYRCEICGNTGEWNGLPLSLQLDHRDGNHKNHTIENLRFLCPNCHSQTKNFSGRNKKTTSS